MLHSEKPGRGADMSPQAKPGTADSGAPGSNAPFQFKGLSVSPARLLVGGIVVIALVAFAVVKLTGNQSAAPGMSGQRPPVPVVTARVSEHPFADEIDVIGTAEARESIDVTSKVTEVVARVNFSDGQTVKKDDILVELTDDQQSADLAEERAALIEAERQYKRIADLVGRGASTQSRLDTAIAQRDQAQARVKAMEAQLADRLIRAPFSGVLGLRHVSPGTLMQPGDLITTLDDISVIKFNFSVPEAFLSSLAPGMEVKAHAVAYPDKTFVGTVTAIDTRIDPDTRAVKVRAEIENESGLLKPGMLLTAKLMSRQRTSLAVSDEALLQRSNKSYVFVVQDADGRLTVAQREVTLGGRSTDLVEVLSGLSKGEEVLVQGVNMVAPGSTVQRVEPASGTGEEPAGLQ